jgi:hypothetical protein
MAIKDERAKAVDAALAQIEKQFGKGSIVRLGSEAVTAIPVISTGSISFDAALGVGGVPRGRVTEIYGPESSGKTTITLQIIAEAQRAGGLAAFVDAEHALDPGYETYFEKREEAHMRESFRGTRTLRFLWREQRGLCPVCNIKITRITGWRLHYCVSRTMGGSNSAVNCVLLHPECHDRVHRLRLSVSKPRLLQRGVRSA